MANELDEMSGLHDDEGQNINVINKQIKVKVGIGSLIFEILLWITIPVFGLVALMTDAMPQNEAFMLMVIGIFPGVIFLFMKINALSYLRQLQQKIQADASQIDNYLEQRVVILQNVVGLVEKSIDFDKEVMTSIAAYRSGYNPEADFKRNETSQQLDGMFSRINVAFEEYPELQAHSVLADAMHQNSYLQKEITAARTLYNDTLTVWNQAVFAWPTKQIVAAKSGYTTRIPFAASVETKIKARGTFF